MHLRQTRDLSILAQQGHLVNRGKEAAAIIGAGLLDPAVEVVDQSVVDHPDHNALVVPAPSVAARMVARASRLR